MGLMKGLNHDEFMFMVRRDLEKAKPSVKNEADLYIWDKMRSNGKKDALHKRRQPHWKNK